MKSRIVVLSFLLLSAYCLPLPGQMSSVVNSLADDDKAYPYDDPDTEEDESIDGICEDELGRCTLRAALDEASYIGTSAYVSFDGSLSGNLVVDDSQGAFSPPDNSIIQGVNQKVIIYGSNFNTSILFGLGNSTAVTGLGFANGLIGMIISGDNNLVGSTLSPVHSNYFHHFSQNGIIVTGNNNNIAGNRIGIAYDNTPIGSLFGIFVTGSENVIGGTSPGDGNIISGNDKGIGIYTLEGSTYIYGNKIGTDSTGTLPVGNKVGIDNIGPNVYIGNNTAGGMNVISGNTESGILMGTMAQNCVISRNHIGTDPSATQAVPNRDGITLGPGSFYVAVENNRISYNSQNGILISGIPDPQLESDFHSINGNEILFNENAGILLVGAAHYNIIGSSLTGILDPNQIKFNGTAGVTLVNSLADPQQNTIRRNSFQDNTLLGIQIVAGQGNIQPPVLMTYTEDGGGLSTISGTHTLAGAVIDLYAGDANAAHNYEGITWLGEAVTDGNGEFSATLPTCACDTLVATATDILGNTSEFSEGLSAMTTSVTNQPFDILRTLVLPNPFQESVMISFELPQGGDVELNICDPSGRLIRSLHRGRMERGPQEIIWNTEGVSPGLYFYKLVFGGGESIGGRLMCVK